MLTSRRGAFSLPEILVAIAIIAALSVVTIPAVMNKLTEARAAALAQTLDGINEAVQSYRGNVGRYPRSLTQLTAKPLSGAPVSCNLAADTLPAVNANQWRGPYSSRVFQSGGTQIGDGTISNTLRRVPPTGATTYANLFVDVANVDRDVAFLVERYFDGISTTPDYLGGTVLWTVSTEPVGTLSFGIPVRGC